MLGLITDRTQYNVFRRASLSAKGWSGMTSAERIEWNGNPLDATGVNLLPYGPSYSSTVDIAYRNNNLIATSVTGGIYLYSELIIGEATNYQNKTFTLSVSGIEATNGATPQVALYWHENGQYTFAGGSLMAPGSVTFNTSNFPNTNNLRYLAMYVYVTSDVTVTAGTTAKFVGLMLENGSVRHDFVPYTEVLPTDATKGAYNYSDLNRVERVVAEISDTIGLNLVTKTDWTMWDIPTASAMERYLSNVVAIRDHFSIEGDLPSSMNNFTYNDANNIEKILSTALGMVSVG